MTFLAVLFDGRLASGSGGFLGDKTIRVWDLGSGACDRVLEGHAEVRQGDGRVCRIYVVVDDDFKELVYSNICAYVSLSILKLAIDHNNYILYFTLLLIYYYYHY